MLEEGEEELMDLEGEEEAGFPAKSVRLLDVPTWFLASTMEFKKIATDGVPGDFAEPFLVGLLFLVYGPRLSGRIPQPLFVNMGRPRL